MQCYSLFIQHYFVMSGYRWVMTSSVKILNDRSAGFRVLLLLMEINTCYIGGRSNNYECVWIRNCRQKWSLYKLQIQHWAAGVRCCCCMRQRPSAARHLERMTFIIRNPTPQSMRIFNYLNNPAKFHPNPIWNDGALGFFKQRRHNKNKNNNNNKKNKMSNDMGSSKGKVKRTMGCSSPLPWP